MSTISLPENPDLGQLKKQAKDLRSAYVAGEPRARALVARHVSGDSGAAPPDALRLNVAQLVVARRYGFASWAHLKRHVELVSRLSRAPDEAAATAEPADEFIRLACLTYGDDGPERWAAARPVLAEHPGLAETSYPRRRRDRRCRTARGDFSRRTGSGPRRTAARSAGQPLLVAGLRPARSPHRPDAVLATGASCCSMPAPTRTPDTCGMGCRARSRCSPGCSVKASWVRSANRATPPRERWPVSCWNGAPIPTTRRPSTTGCSARERPPRAALRVRSRHRHRRPVATRDLVMRWTRRPSSSVPNSAGP